MKTVAYTEIACFHAILSAIHRVKMETLYLKFIHIIFFFISLFPFILQFTLEKFSHIFFILKECIRVIEVNKILLEYFLDILILF